MNQPAALCVSIKKPFQHDLSCVWYFLLCQTTGDLNVELHCDLAPRTCENFLALCEMGYYDGIVFHRSIKNFMLQVWTYGVDPGLRVTHSAGLASAGWTVLDSLCCAVLFFVRL